MPKVPLSLKNLKMFLSKDKLEKLIPLFKGLENQAKNVIGEYGFNALQGVSNGFMTGDLLHGIADTAAARNETIMMNKIKDNYLKINVLFDKLLKSVQTDEYSKTILAYIEKMFPEKEIREFIDDLVFYLQKNRVKGENSPVKKGGYIQEPIAKCRECSSERIILRVYVDDDANHDFCEEVYKKYCCKMNKNEEVESLLAGFKSACQSNLLYIINGLLADDMRYIRFTEQSVENNTETVGGANPAALLKVFSKLPKLSAIKNLGVKNLGSKNLGSTSFTKNLSIKDAYANYSQKAKNLLESNVRNSNQPITPKDTGDEMSISDFIPNTAATETPTQSAAEVNSAAVDESNDKYIFDKYRNFLQNLLNNEFNTRSQDCADKIHDLTNKNFYVYYPQDVIEHNLRYFCISILNNKNVFSANAKLELDGYLKLSDDAEVKYNDSLENVETFNELEDLVLKNINRKFGNTFLEKLPPIANAYRNLVFRKMNAILTDVLSRTLSPIGGRSKKNKKRKSKKNRTRKN